MDGQRTRRRTSQVAAEVPGSFEECPRSAKNHTRGEQPNADERDLEGA